MNSKLDTINNWDQLAKRSGFRIALLAKQCEVSQRQLERYIHLRFHTNARVWITDLRLEFARGLLREGSSVKRAAAEAAYATPSHLSRAFKRLFGKSPTDFRSRRR